MAAEEKETMRRYFAMEAPGQARHISGSGDETICDGKVENVIADKLN